MGFERVDTTSNRLKIAMNNAGMKQADLVRATGIDKGSISHYLKGRYEPKQDVVFALAKALDVSEMWLWGYDCEMKRPVLLDEIEEKPVETANKLADRLMMFEMLEESYDVFGMLEEYQSLDETKKAQVREYVHLLAGKN